MTVPLAVLAALSLWFWFSLSPIGEGWFHRLVQRPAGLAPAYDTPGQAPAHADAAHRAHYPAMALSILIVGAGIFLAYRRYYNRRAEMISREAATIQRSALFCALHNKWYFDELYDATVLRALLIVRTALAWFDTWIIDGLVNASAYIVRGISVLDRLFDDWVVDGLVNGVAGAIIRAGAGLRRIQTGRLQTYLVLVMAGILVIMVLRII